ncbi:AfsR/SARP family transcriptional regulator [Streptomyces sp. NPDC097619]|uniref:AfsR/SARP family transcriptional regulator n=1 Tax=Streptomyces sp. NPDC097619 TaxID=3157228 RepID=UPI003326D0B9
MLGPLEVMSGGRVVPLGGIKQRATLGYLLLQANRVVPTSQLLGALWQAENTPATARKILQNAVWGLRGILADSAADAEQPAELLTRTPGYLIRVDPDRVDLHVFRRQVREGRDRLAAGAPEDAVRLLSGALRLWRGPVLADLVESGTHWPELTAVQNTRLAVLEDYFEAKLRCGQHHGVLDELESTVESEPLRERSTGQLMLALYRCGRQADALRVYHRIRNTLVEELGLEPGHELRRLQQAVLTHDPALDLSAGGGAVTLTAPAPSPVPVPVPAGPGGAAGLSGPREERRRALAVVDQRRRAHAPLDGRQPAAAATVRVPGPRLFQPSGQLVTERQNLSVLLVQLRLGPHDHGASMASTDEMLERAGSVARGLIERHGGEAVSSIGTVSLGLFRPAPGEHPAARALRAAGALRARLGGGPGDGRGRPAPWQGLTLHASVATGQALVRFRPGEAAPLSVNGALLDLCQRVLALTPPGQIHVCAATSAATSGMAEYRASEGPQPSWRVLGILPDGAAATAGVRAV